MSTAILEAQAGRHALGMAPERFLRDYWQRRPLLIRGAFPHFHNAITPEDLAGLACEEAALARIVLHESANRWRVLNGPYQESDFAKLPASHWTLLVQDVDKWDGDVAALLNDFDFIPSWRIDDVMVSYATDGGGVGAHVDQYDVFLVQASGRRRWRISVDPNSPKEFRDDAELKLLRKFAPTHSWILEPGDALYLPPGIAHEGTALGECMTFSVGMRAPSQADLLLDLADFIAGTLAEERRYTDRDLLPQRQQGEIDKAALVRVRAALPHFSQVDEALLANWFGRFITRYRAAHEAAPRTRRLDPAQLGRKLSEKRLVRNPWSRIAWIRHGRSAELFVAGNSYRCPLALARLLAGHREIAGAALLQSGGTGWLPLLAELVNAGHWNIAALRPSSRGRTKLQ